MSVLTKGVFSSLADMKGEEYRYWKRRPVDERMDAVHELIETAYEVKGGSSSRTDQDGKELSCPWRSVSDRGGCAVIYHAQPGFVAAFGSVEAVRGGSHCCEMSVFLLGSTLLMKLNGR